MVKTIRTVNNKYLIEGKVKVIKNTCLQKIIQIFSVTVSSSDSEFYEVQFSCRGKGLGGGIVRG